MQYFEDLADLIESDEALELSDFSEALSDAVPADTGEMLEYYMDEIENALPDEEGEFYMLIDNIKTGLLFLCEDLENVNSLAELAEELFRFSSWYKEESSVSVNGETMTALEAVTRLREEKLTGASSRYDFSPALDYEIRDLSMKLGSYKEVDVTADPEELN